MMTVCRVLVCVRVCVSFGTRIVINIRTLMQFCPPSGAARCIENRCGTITRCEGNDAKRSETEWRRGRGRGRDCNRNRSLALICHFARMATTAMESSKGGERRGSCLESGHTTSSGSHTHTPIYTHTCV